MDELLDEFIAETRDMLEVLSGQLVQWERTPDDRALLDSVFRFVHTVKGSCGFLELPRLLRLSHAAEDILASARNGELKPTKQLVTAVLQIIDRIALLANALETGKSVYDDDNKIIEAMLSHLPCEGLLEVKVDSDLTNIVESFSFEAHESFDNLSNRNQSRTVRVSLALLDKMMNGVSDLVLARNEVSRHIRNAAEDNELDQAFVRLSSSVTEMRNCVGQMRMQNIDRLFSSLPRIVRDIAYDLDKKIDLHIEGSEVEIDRDMVDALRDPILHILRNSADHGLENEDERRNSGKSPIGSIRIIANQSGNQIVIEISDDGRGIDVDKLRERVIEAKLVTSEEWNLMSVKAQLAMVFVPGLTTTNQITTISGRGVGMDVVHSNIEAVGGSIELESVSGVGLKITLKLPLTLSIIAGLSVQAGDQLFGIPRSAVLELLSTESNMVRLESVGGSVVATIRGDSIPYIKLESLLGIKFAKMKEGQPRTLVIIKPVIGARYALDVASVVDHEELVVKPCAPMIMATGLYAGTSLPDSGRPVLLLDTSGIASAIGIDILSRKIPVNSDRLEAKDVEEASAMALLFHGVDGSKSAIRISAIDKIEEVLASSISFVGGKIRYQNQSGLFDVSGMDTIPDCAKMNLLRLTDGEHFAYFAINTVIDIVPIIGKILPSANPFQHEGVIQVLGDPVELLNIFPFFEDCQSSSIAGKKALCFVDVMGDGHWERHILAPLLLASGYEVSFDPHLQSQANIVLQRGLGKESRSEDKALNTDNRVMKLRRNIQSDNDDPDSIYCYDRMGLLAAIESKLAGER